MHLSTSSKRTPIPQRQSTTIHDLYSGSAHFDPSNGATSCSDLVSTTQSRTSRSVSSEPPSNPFPFHRLPSELFIPIFQEVERSSRYYDRHSTPSSLILSHVCRLWRDIALDTVSLWTYIRIYDAHTDDHHYSDLFFERSKSSLIDVSYHFHNPSNAAVAISRLQLHITRVRQLTIMIEQAVWLSLIMDLLKEVVMPRLESLRISLLDPMAQTMFNSGMWGTDAFPVFADSAPLLRSAQINGILCLAPLLFTQLTSLTFKMPDNGSYIQFMGQFLDLLDNVAATLIRLRVWDVMFFWDGDELSSPCVELPVLESLDLLGVHFLPSLHTPLLRRLYMKNVSESTLEAFTERCSSSEFSTLGYLTFEELDLSYFENKTAVIRGLPFLTKLVIWNCMGETSFLGLLNGKGLDNESGQGVVKGSDSYDQSVQPASDNSVMNLEKPEVVPRLHSLTSSAGSSWSLLQAIVQDRIERGIPIKHVYFLSTVQYSREKELWLTERNVDCEWRDWDMEELLEPEDLEWLEEEECFLWNAEGEDAQEVGWSDNLSDDYRDEIIDQIEYDYEEDWDSEYSDDQYGWD